MVLPPRMVLPTTLPPGLSLWLQAVALSPTGQFRLTTPALVTTP